MVNGVRGLDHALDIAYDCEQCDEDEFDNVMAALIVVSRALMLMENEIAGHRGRARQIAKKAR